MKDLQTKENVTRIEKLAETLRKDIHSRSLCEGDHYLTAAEASRMLGVSRVMANRAMNVLAGQRLLTRHRRRGTFIGPAFQPSTSPPRLRVVHVIKGLLKDERQWTYVVGDCLHGLHTVLPGYQVQSNVIPQHNPAEMLRQIFKQHSSKGSLAGIILLSCPREVQEIAQELVREQRIPAVSFGSLYPNITNIPSVDQNQFEMGRLEAKYLIDRGHHRIALLMRDHWLPGDNLLASGVNQALADANLSYGVLSTHSTPEVPKIIKAELAHILSLDDRPTGLICRSPMFAETAVEVARSRSMRVPEDLDIITDCNEKYFPATSGLPRVRPIHSSSKTLTMVAEILERIISGKKIENNHTILPVELVGPGE
ncbi:MAG: substrate-binding domain-containing protein [Pirellulales bacterium]|nr:substrate-binding domain-containing protein [Pirellulales bacterium]